MRLNSFTDFSLRVLIYLGLSRDDLSTARQISEAYAISHNHLGKVVHQLTKLNVIESFKGKGGGIRLKKEPHEINIGTIIRRLECESPLVECFTETGSCVLNPACSLKKYLNEANNAFYSSLEKYTLADIIKPKSSLRQGLGL